MAFNCGLDLESANWLSHVFCTLRGTSEQSLMKIPPGVKNTRGPEGPEALT